jgi:imidazolonepropionase-like amidohydrolase
MWAWLAVSVGCGPIAAPPPPAERGLLIRGARVFDGDQVLASADVLVRGDRIERVGRGLVAGDVEVIEAAGLTLLPGLIDSHVHLWDPAQLEREALFGVTTVIDMGESAPVLAQLNQWQATHPRRPEADFRSAGSPVTAPGGHGTEYDFPVPTVRAPGEAQAFVDARIAEGSELIKLMYTPGSPLASISKETLAAAVSTAHARGELAVVHIETLQGAHDAVDAGVDGLAHLFADRPADVSFTDAVVAHHAFVVPTLTVLARRTGHAIGPELVADPEIAPLLLPDDIANLTKTYRQRPELDYTNAEQAVRSLRDAGAPVLVGSDSGSAHGVSLHGELELLVRAGLSPLQALEGATRLAAARWRLGDRGEIAAGRRADLVLVRGDPTTEIRAARAIVAVWCAGRRVVRLGAGAGPSQTPSPMGR